jgi:endo-1,4-beta-xylanase
MRLFAGVVGLVLSAFAGSAHAADDTLRSLAEARGFHVGAAVAVPPFRNDETYVAVLAREFNMIVAENAFKWSEIHVSPKAYRFNNTDALVKFAEDNGMAIRGHTLVWHNQLPAWLVTGNFTRDQVIEFLHNHIQTVVGRYKGKIGAWDVVNEAVPDSGGGLRKDSFWFQKIGPDYIKLAFEFAHEADPDAKLYYNDYSNEDMGAKSNAIFKLVKGLKEAGVPIDGVGWQMHVENGFRIGSANRKNAERLAALGLEISITELDVRGKAPMSAAALAKQGQAYGDITAFCRAQLNCKAVVLWGFTDKYSWIPGFFKGAGDALIYDADYKPKPGYAAMLKALAAPAP